ncbi:hypothetical protein GCM10029964_117790 [Kibdelosporangium lantanae]
MMYPTSFRPFGEVLGAETLHAVFRDWLTDLGHPQPTEARKESTPDPIPS